MGVLIPIIIFSIVAAIVLASMNDPDNKRNSNEEQEYYGL